MIEEQSGVRILTDSDGIKEVYETLAGPTRDHLVDWDDRSREHKKRLFSGDIKQIATVYRELVTLYRSYGLSYGDSKNIEVAKKFLVSEISLAEGISEQEATEKIRSVAGAH
jgi:CarD family transcriptional regulator